MDMKKRKMKQGRFLDLKERKGKGLFISFKN